MKTAQPVLTNGIIQKPSIPSTAQRIVFNGTEWQFAESAQEETQVIDAIPSLKAICDKQKAGIVNAEPIEPPSDAGPVVVVGESEASIDS